MPYEKIGFTKGDVLKAEHLNHIEEGIYDIAENTLSLEEVQAEIQKYVDETILGGAW